MGNKSKRLQYDACPAKRYHGGAYGKDGFDGIPRRTQRLAARGYFYGAQGRPRRDFSRHAEQVEKTLKKRQDFEIGKDIGEHDKNGDISPHYGDGGNA